MRKLLIDGKQYNVKQAIEKARQILKKEKRLKKGTEDYNFVLWLLLQRRANIDYNKVDLKVALNQQYKDFNCFYYKTSDTEWDSFSYKKALASTGQKIENHSGDIFHKKDILSAFRFSISQQIKMFREKELNKNKHLKTLAQENCFNVHTDHVIPFHVLVSDFLMDRGMTLQDVQIKQIKNSKGGEYYVLVNQTLSSEWKLYHQEHAKLRLLTATENLSKAGKYDIPLYHYKKERLETYD